MFFFLFLFGYSSLNLLAWKGVYDPHDSKMDGQVPMVWNGWISFHLWRVRQIRRLSFFLLAASMLCFPMASVSASVSVSVSVPSSTSFPVVFSP